MKTNLFILLIGVLLVSCQTDEEKAEEAFGKCEAELNAGDTAAALVYLTKAEELNTKNSDTWIRIGLKYGEIGEEKNAIEAYTKAIELEPTLKGYWIRAKERNRIGDYEGAMMDFTEAIELSPKSSLLWYCRGMVHIDLRNYSSAIYDFSKAIELEPTDAFYFSNRANAKLLNRDQEGACADALVAERLGVDIDISEYCD